MANKPPGGTTQATSPHDEAITTNDQEMNTWRDKVYQEELTVLNNLLAPEGGGRLEEFLVQSEKPLPYPQWVQKALPQYESTNAHFSDLLNAGEAWAKSGVSPEELPTTFKYAYDLS